MSKKVIFTTLVVSNFISAFLGFSHALADDSMDQGIKTPEPKTIRILSIDGGGQRGIVPAALLTKIEEETGKPISELFDVFAGTSTGSIIALGLTIAGDTGARFSAKDIVGIYETQGAEIFQKEFQYYATLAGKLGPKYSPHNLKKVLHEHYGDTLLSAALKPVYVTAYDLENSMPFTFSSEDAKSSPDLDVPMRKVARASSAAPSFFPPCHMKQGDGTKVSLSDGCLWALDPTEMVYEQVRRNNPGAKISIVSLGTGTTNYALSHSTSKSMGAFAWGSPLIGHLIHTQGHTSRSRLNFEASSGRLDTYLRVNFALDENKGAMDDTSPENLAYLSSKIHSIIDGDETFARVVSLTKSWARDMDRQNREEWGS